MKTVTDAVLDLQMRLDVPKVHTRAHNHQTAQRQGLWDDGGQLMYPTNACRCEEIEEVFGTASECCHCADKRLRERLQATGCVSIDRTMALTLAPANIPCTHVGVQGECWAPAWAVTLADAVDWHFDHTPLLMKAMREEAFRQACLTIIGMFDPSPDRAAKLRNYYAGVTGKQLD